jgi:prophage antirepressor-like protein
MKLVKSENFGAVKCDFWRDENGQIWMTREQIGRALEYADPDKAIANIHDRNHDRLDKFSTTLNLRKVEGNREVTRKMTVYCYKGIYEICRFSRQPKADAFMDWVWEVVESIRKYGLYATSETIDKILADPDFGIRLAFKEEQQKRKEAEAKIEKQKPLVEFAETCLSSSDSILIRELAKIASKQGIKIGQNRLYKKLREWKMILPNSTEPYQDKIDAGFFEVIERPTETPYGVILT